MNKRSSVVAITFSRRNYEPVFINTFDDGDGDGDGGGDSGKQQQQATTFTQEQVNGIVAAERKKIEGASKLANSETLNQLKMLQTKATLSDEERTGLEGQITELNKKVFTSEELGAQERKKTATKFEEEKVVLTADRDAWQGRFTEATISRSITDAAVKNEAYNPTQIVAIIRPQTRLAEVKDEDGKVTGYAPVVTAMVTDEKTKETKELELTVDQALAQMKENKEFFNLFKGKSLDGMGAGNGGAGGGSTKSVSEMSMEEYEVHRAKEKKAGRL